LHTIPVAFNAVSELARDIVMLLLELLEQLNIEVVTEE